MEKVTIVEVGPRDGLQNEPKNIPTALKIDFINKLSQSGLPVIEATSFVSPKWVPQMADHSDVIQGIERNTNVRYSALVPNEHGLEDALATNIQEIAVFTAASETFSKKNTNCTIAESLERIKNIIDLAKERNIMVRGYVSCTLGCPYEGDIELSAVTALSEKLIDLGCYQVSLGDTIGVGTAKQAKNMVKAVKQHIAVDQLAIHFHDTYAQALTNIYACLDEGIRTIDSAVAGLGGCPYAPGAGGNVATEDVVYLLNGLGLETGIDLNKLTAAGKLICDYLEQTPRSKVALALSKASYRKN